MAKKELQLKTKRLLISPMSQGELKELRDGIADEELKKAYGEMLEGCRKHPEQWHWYTAWKICMRKEGQMVGDLCFKGPVPNYSVEIGYGILEEYQRNGYAGEAAKALIEWAFYMCFGLSIGLALGNSLGNIAMGICIGVALGLLLGTVVDSSWKKQREKIRMERKNTHENTDERKEV